MISPYWMDFLWPLRLWREMDFWGPLRKGHWGIHISSKPKRSPKMKRLLEEGLYGRKNFPQCYFLPSKKQDFRFKDHHFTFSTKIGVALKLSEKKRDTPCTPMVKEDPNKVCQRYNEDEYSKGYQKSTTEILSAFTKWNN